MSVTIVGTTKGGSASAISSASVVTPAGTASGDLIVFAITGKSTLTSPTYPSLPTGVAAVGAGRGLTTSGRMDVFRKVATAGGAQTITVPFYATDGVTTLSVVHSWICVVLRDQATSGEAAEVLSTGAAGTAASVGTQSVTPSEDAELILRFVGGLVASGTTDEKSSTWDGSDTLLANAQGTGGTTTGLSWISAAYEVGPTPAASVAGRTLSLQNTPQTWGSLTLGIKAAPAGPPVNSVAPAVTGTASVGSTLTSGTGTWNPTGTYTYQWQRDGVDIGGATASTYTVVSGDAGHTIRCVVTATNGSGNASANSNGVSIPSAPVNTVAPVITTDGTPATGETVTCSTGTWTGTGITYAYQWYRGASPITGETTSSYLLAVSDEGANITCRVTATNGGGAQEAVSNTIVPAVTAPLSDASGLWYYSGGTGNTDPGLSIGGGRGGTIPDATLSNIFGPIPGSVAQAGGHLYAVIYVRNTHATTTDPATKLFVLDQPDTAGLHIDVAVPTEGVNTAVAALASNTTPPSGASFSRPSDFAGGLTFGDLAAGQWRGVYVRLTIDPDTTPVADDAFTLRVRSETA